jgi:pyrroline-5-carboxylate reductase
MQRRFFMATSNERIGFIGSGNMATALVKGLIESKVYKKDRLSASDKDATALNRLSEQFGIKSFSQNTELVRNCDIVVLSVKPQNMRDVLNEIKEEVRDDHLFISIAAGIPLRLIHSIIDRDIPLVRVMPNTPALIQKGISAISGGTWAEKKHMATARTIFNSVGETVDVDESMMDAVTALSGSGPGYVFRILECIVEAGIQIGLGEDIALELAVQTFLGAAQLAKSSEESLETLRERVTSPGGTTAAGLRVFEELGLENTIIKAIKTANQRSIELGKTV